MTSLKEWMDQQWRNPGVQYAGNGVVYKVAGNSILPLISAGSNRTYKSKEQKAYEAQFGIYNKKLVPIILAEATVEMRPGYVRLYDERKRYISSKKGELPHYTWPKEANTPVESVPRKRVSHKKVTQAAAILARVPEHELTAFLARFGLSLSLAASIASLDNVEQIARQFLRATL